MTRLPIDRVALIKVAKIAGVSSGKQDQYFRHLKVSIDAAWLGTSQKSKRVYRNGVIRELKKYRQAIKELKELLALNSDDGTAAVEKLHAKIQTRRALAGMMKKRYSDFEQNSAVILDTLEEAISTADSLVVKSTRRVGRPTGKTGTNAAADSFLYCLLYYTRACGGHLTFARQGGEPAGKLIEAAEVLKPFLPTSLLPEAGGATFYERIAARVSADLRKDPV
jgi:hypothetical protein